MTTRLLRFAILAIAAVALPSCGNLTKMFDEDDDDLEETVNPYPGEDFEDVPESYVLTPSTVASSCLPGEGTQQDPFQIRNAMELKYFIESVNSGQLRSLSPIELDSRPYINLEHDIEIDPDYAWEPIGSMAYPFSGAFNGNGHIITGTLNISPQQEAANPAAAITFDKTTKAGMFGYAENAEIERLQLSAAINIQTSGMSMFIGSIAALTTSTWINNCVFNGSITLPSGKTFHQLYLGGLVGYLDSGYFNYNSMEGSLKFGHNSLPVSKFTANYAYIGGLAGLESWATMSNCTNTADIDIDRASTFEMRVGGIMGMRYAGGAQFPTYTNFSNMHNEGNISVNNISGGSVNGQSATIYVGGFYGEGGQTIEASGSTNSGDITVNNTKVTTYAGGLGGLGYRSNFTNATNNGSITNHANAGCTGGCFGYLLGDASFLQNNGTVTSSVTKGKNDYSALTGPVGGIAGYVGGSIHNCSNSGNINSPDPFDLDCGYGMAPVSYAGAIAGLGREIYTCNSNSGTVNGTRLNSDSDPRIFLGYLWLIAEIMDDGSLNTTNPTYFPYFHTIFEENFHVCGGH